MYRIDIISVQPQLMESPLNHSIVQRAKDKGIVEIVLHNLKDYGLGNYKQVDDTVYGGGAGMVIRCEPVFECVNKLKSEREYDEIIYMCPDGELYNQKQANQLSIKKNIIILCGHYKGIDQRIRDYLITKEISIGRIPAIRPVRPSFGGACSIHLVLVPDLRRRTTLPFESVIIQQTLRDDDVIDDAPIAAIVVRAPIRRFVNRPRQIEQRTGLQ